MSERIPAPEDASYETDLLGFIQEAIQESESFLRASPNWDKVELAERAVLSSRGDSLMPSSGVESNHVAKVETQLVAGMTDTRPFWEYRTFNKNYQKQTEILGKIALHLWLQRGWDMRWADMIRGCATGGTAYAHQFWNDEVQDLDMCAEDVRDVLPIRPSDSWSIQSCFGVIVRRERTVNYLKAKYPQFAHWIVADRDGTAGAAGTRFDRLMERLGSPFRAQLFGNRRQNADLPRIPTAEEYTIYLDDRRENESRHAMYMGDWHLAPIEGCRLCLIEGTPHALNNWSYIVEPGERVYPQKRLIIATSRKILYDNTSIYWHGKFPLTKLTLDPKKGSYIGKGLVWDVLSLQKFLDRQLSMFDVHIQKWRQPDLIGDKNTLSQSEFKKIDTSRPGLKVRFNPMAGKGMEIRYPDAFPAYIFDIFKWTIEEIASISGAHDMSGVMQLNQLPSADSVERLMEAMTPEVRMRSRILEAFTREFAMITASNIAQFKTLAERIALLGPDGATFEDFDYDPDTLIPAYIHASDYDNEGHPTAEAIARGPMPRRDRAREFFRQVSMHIAPGSLLSASEITDKLMYLTLARDGMIDPETLMDKLGVPNFGQIPGKTILEKLMNIAQLGMGAGPRMGRPPTAQEMPTPKPSPNGVTVSESG